MTQWCWATQAADALVAIQALITDAAEAEQTAVDPAALAEQIHAFIVKKEQMRCVRWGYLFDWNEPVSGCCATSLS